MTKFAKGHGTENDFVIIPDTNADLELNESRVAALCDRQRGLGADGILRVAKAGALIKCGTLTELPDDVVEDDWFMDYRNADGSIAEMCGNGVRVFAHYVAAHHAPESVVDGHLRVGTRAGLRPVEIIEIAPKHAEVSVGMGAPEVLGLGTVFVSGSEGQESFAGLGIDVGNPHLACVVPSLTAESLKALPLGGTVQVAEDMFPNGVNLEILTALDGSRAVHMRVIERGVGETRSCGTGTVAAALSALADEGETHGSVTVHVPGGTVRVDVVEAENEESEEKDGRIAYLTGPSIIHTFGDIDLDAVESAPVPH